MEHKSNSQTESLAARRTAERGRQSPATFPAGAREFLSHLRDKNPQQAMDIVGESNLTSGIVLATLCTVGFMFVMTIGPYFLGTPADAAKKAAKPAEKLEVAATSSTTNEATPAPATTEKSDKPALSRKALDQLGVDEVKEVSRDVNPLEDKFDDLLNKAR